MAREVNLGGSGSLFVGEDKTIRLTLVSEADETVAVDMTGWDTLFDVRKKDTSAAPAIVSITPTITGVFNVSASLNAQEAVVQLTDDHLNLFKEQTYRWSWKRMTAASETVLAWGNFAPQKATAP